VLEAEPGVVPEAEDPGVVPEAEEPGVVPEPVGVLPEPLLLLPGGGTIDGVGLLPPPPPPPPPPFVVDFLPSFFDFDFFVFLPPFFEPLPSSSVSLSSVKFSSLSQSSVH
jgi:hypothetical protein